MSSHESGLGGVKAIERFRVLVIGNANAGKTTILEKICHANGRNPYFLDDKGIKIDSELKSSIGRGEHDINTQIVYPTAKGFIFHDSRGFEAGTSDELEKVREFIRSRAEKEELKDQLHVIWYCLPTSNDRALTKAEMSLFESGTGNVPVIAIFTKMDALDKKVFSEQLNKGVSLQEAKENVPSLAKAKFERDYFGPLKDVPCPPRDTVQLRNMNKTNTNCDTLLRITALALDEKTLKLLFLSVQRNNVGTCIDHVIREIIIPSMKTAFEQQQFSEQQQKSLVRDVMACFPHALPSFDHIIGKMHNNAQRCSNEAITDLEAERLSWLSSLLERAELEAEFFLSFERRLFRLEEASSELFLDNEHLDKCYEALLPFVSSLSATSYIQCRVLNLGIVMITIMTYSLFELSTLSTGIKLHDFKSVLDVYMGSHSSEMIATLEEGFKGSDRVADEDASKLYDIVMASPLMAATLHK